MLPRMTPKNPSGALWTLYSARTDLYVVSGSQRVFTVCPCKHMCTCFLWHMCSGQKTALFIPHRLWSLESCVGF